MTRAATFDYDIDLIEQAQYKFVLCDHTYAYVDRIADELEDCDVIALEAVGFANEESREEYGRLFTTYISSATTLEERAAIDDKYKTDIERHERSRNYSTMEANMREQHFLRRFAGSDKQVVFCRHQCRSSGLPSFNIESTTRWCGLFARIILPSRVCESITG